MLLDPWKTLEYIKKFLFGKKYIIYNDGFVPAKTLKLICDYYSIDYYLYEKENNSHPTMELYQLINLAESNNQIILSSLTRERLTFGIYHKYGPDNGDVFPFGTLYFSEIQHLYSVLSNTSLISEAHSCSLEWLLREEDRAQILQAKNPAQHSTWGGYTGEQRLLYAKFHQSYQKNLHKGSKDILRLRLKEFIK